MDRVQAIARLQECGFVARERHWALGDTIVVCALPFEAGGIQAYAAMEYLFPGDGETWGLTDFMRAGPQRMFASLEEAVAAMTERMRAAIAERQS